MRAAVAGRLTRHCAVLIAASIAMSLPPFVSAQAIDAARSSVTATFKQMGAPVEGRFTKIAGEIVVPSAAPASARARVVIETASFDLGDAAYNAELLKKEWFDTARFPTASFASSAVTAGATGRFDATGQLTIKGRTVAVTGPLTLRTEAGATVVEGAWTIRRLAFGIGDGEWKDTSLLADEVVVKFKLVVPAK